MPRINRIPKMTFIDVMKQKNLEKAALINERKAAIAKDKEQKFDTFVKNTAKDMLKSRSNYDLKIFEANSNLTIPQNYSDNSVWAPWSKLFNK